ncbi:MAG: DUF1906 domain-containing protein [Candidatus Syntrophopropionicum ammoniitolerans]
MQHHLVQGRPEALADAGVEFVCRYLMPLARYAWKRLTGDEAEYITGAGMQIGSVFETTASRAAAGAAAGRADGVAAYKEAQLICQPKDTAIYFAVDYDAQPADYDAIEAYLRAAEEQIPGYRVGVYGLYTVVEEMAHRELPGIFGKHMPGAVVKRARRQIFTSIKMMFLWRV